MSKKITKNCKGTAFLAHDCSVFLHICMVLWRISPHGGILTRCVRGQGNAQKKSDTQACHSECLHNGIILIAYILQIFVGAKVMISYEIRKSYTKFFRL